MIPFCDRRSACLFAQSLLFSSFQPPLTLPRLQEGTQTTNVRELARFLALHCPSQVLEAVRDSGGKFLYRGEEPKDSCYQEKSILLAEYSNDMLIRACDPSPDLLLAETYGYDAMALGYFQNLDQLLDATIAARPSIGHIATSDASEAGKWGRVVSIWPLKPLSQGDMEFSYVWPSHRSVFYNGRQNSEKDDANSLVINTSLSDALEINDGREVLFAFSSSKRQASAAFLAVPKELDNILRDELERIGYGI